LLQQEAKELCCAHARHVVGMWWYMWGSSRCCTYTRFPQDFAADGRTPDRTWSTLALSDMALLCPGPNGGCAPATQPAHCHIAKSTAHAGGSAMFVFVCGGMHSKPTVF
jgi:hypothetical protein